MDEIRNRILSGISNLFSFPAQHPAIVIVVLMGLSLGLLGIYYGKTAPTKKIRRFIAGWGMVLSFIVLIWAAIQMSVFVVPPR